MTLTNVESLTSPGRVRWRWQLQTSKAASAPAPSPIACRTRPRMWLEGPLRVRWPRCSGIPDLVAQVGYLARYIKPGLSTWSTQTSLR
jgi:hypothetical protein